MANKNLNKAQEANLDEFYTQYRDIENEVMAYIEYDPNVFKGKTVLLPCDDPEWSNFTKFFARRFTEFGLKKLISTSYAPDSKKLKEGYQPSFFETDSLQFDPQKNNAHGKIFILEKDTTGDGIIDDRDLEWTYLDGDGDFRSEEVIKLRDEADFIITNPPFSQFRDFFQWLIDSKKKFLCICNKNILSAKDVFPYVMKNKVWGGSTPTSQDLLFDVPNEIAEYFVANEKEGSKYKIIDGKVMGRSASIWITNIEHGIRHSRLKLTTMAKNIKYVTHKDLKGLKEYIHYENYDAIEVPGYKSIPSDYDGIMGVPISFLGVYCPEQFEILGITDRGNKYGLKTKEYTIKDTPKYSDLNRRAAMYVNGELKSSYIRLLIRRKD